MSAICRFVHAEKAQYTIVLLCRVLKTARSTYYAWVAGIETRETRRRADEALTHEITVIHLARRAPTASRASPPNCAARDTGWRVERVMRQHGITSHSRHNGRRSLTKQDSQAAPSPDLIGRDFHASRPGMKVVGDITYIPTAEGWLYLATWLDLATREIIGYSMAGPHRAELVVDALAMAAGLGRLGARCAIHTDRGSEYTSSQFHDRIRVLNLRQSMGRTGICYDNAAAQSFFAVLKEEIGTRFWPEGNTARAEIFTFETFYNRRRLRKHINWGYLTPHETRLRHQQDQTLGRNRNMSMITGKLQCHGRPPGRSGQACQVRQRCCRSAARLQTCERLSGQVSYPGHQPDQGRAGLRRSSPSRGPRGADQQHADCSVCRAG
ncbi:IS3 family transposase [Streptomyces sp. H27-H1]|uniref:IS3 family transposase n=1 Tax=Streptomyces sp. H27-H1 TaxID=2996461 RepID=UPI0022721E2C|nr:IS3 family transposase [Streptomyces sp. H27-H1]MCY0932539.1 IS3 family transposase [Streptomyces sp. H27-H1]